MEPWRIAHSDYDADATETALIAFGWDTTVVNNKVFRTFSSSYGPAFWKNDLWMTLLDSDNNQNQCFPGIIARSEKWDRAERLT